MAEVVEEVRVAVRRFAADLGLRAGVIENDGKRPSVRMPVRGQFRE